MLHIDDVERRARLARRHALAPGHGATDPEGSVRAMTVLHATEPATVFLSCWARVPDVTVADVERALFVDRTLVKQLAMRRTLWVFPRDLLPAAWGSASLRVAATERARMTKDLEKAGLTTDGSAWLDAARGAVLAVLAEHPDGLSGLEVRTAVPEYAVKIAVSAGSVWGPARVLTHLGLTHDIVRSHNTAHWRLSRHRWTLMERWLGDVPPAWSAPEGYVELVRRWLATFGPGTEDDLVWWLGSTKTVVRAALAALDAVQVGLDGGAVGWVLPDDVDPVDPVGPWVALLPVLDPTTMGWKARGWYLGPHAPALFDANGNAGTTVWVDGRVVGCWVQDETGVVVLHLLEPVTAEALRRLEAEAARLTAWLDGTVIGTVYPSAAMKTARGGRG